MLRRAPAALMLPLLLAATPSRAGVRPHHLFRDHMVLQQGMAVPVWGTADPGEAVTVRFGGQERSAAAGADGKWRVRLDDLRPGGPSEMTVSGKDSVTIRDVLVGEVWLCSGQSNMDMSVAREDRSWCGVNNEAEEIASADHPRIREFRVRVTMTDEPRSDVEGHWAVCSPGTVGKFSAAAYFFARALQKDLDVPVGLVTSCYGASTAQAWIGRDALAARPELAPLLADYDAARKSFASDAAAREKSRRARAKWEAAAAQARAAGRPAPKEPKDPDPGQDQHNPSVLANGMIAPLVPFAIRGALWYQGESNGPTAERYFALMETLIRDWRRAWGEGDFPFLFVQLANIHKPPTRPIGRDHVPLIREAQLRTLSLPNTGMAVAIDIGDPDNVHPKNKQEVGRRLALAALALVYGKPVPHSGPIYDGLTVEGGSLRLRFRHAEGGLVAPGGSPTGFVIAGEDGHFSWADARIDGETVVVSSPSVPRPVSARYGWADNPPVNLTNRSGLPASPFRTDAPPPGP